MTLKILNLYAGIGGNRKLWSGDIEVRDISAVKDFILSKVQYGVLYPRSKLFKLGKKLYGVRDCEVYAAIADIRMKGGMYYCTVSKTKGYFWKV